MDANLEQTRVDANLTLGSTSGTGSATINVQSGGTFTTNTGTMTINATGTVNVGLVGDGTFNANGNNNSNGEVNIVGGTLNVGSAGDFNLFSGTLTASSGGLVDFNGSYDIGSTTITSGASLTAAEFNVRGGTLNVDGANSTVTGGAVALLE